MSNYYLVHDGSAVWGRGKTVKEATLDAALWTHADSYKQLTVSRCSEDVYDMANADASQVRIIFNSEGVIV